MIIRKKETISEKWQSITRLYIEAGNKIPFSKRDIASWALRNGFYEPKKRDLIEEAAREIGDALRQELFTTSDGKHVRRWHAVRLDMEDGEQQYLWLDIDKAPSDLMKKSFQNRREQILGDCKQLNTDKNYYNKKNDVEIQICFDFEEDIAESEQPTIYITD